MRKSIRILLLFFALVCLLSGAILIHHKTTYLDKTITQGEGFGLTIGFSRQETYLTLKTLYKDKRIYTQYPINENMLGPLLEISFSESNYNLIAKSDIWNFYYADSFLDFLQLEFEDDMLIKIYRHKQAYELP